MPNRGSPVTSSNKVTAQEASWALVTIKPTQRIVAKYNDGSNFDIPVVGYLQIRGQNEENEEAPLWVAAVIDPTTGRVYDPSEDSNFIKIDVNLVPEEYTIIP